MKRRREQRLRVIATVTVVAGIYLIATGGDRSTAQILLLVGILYAVIALIAEWRGRRP